MKQKTLTNNLKETRIEEKQFQTQAISQFDRQPKDDEMLTLNSNPSSPQCPKDV